MQRFRPGGLFARLPVVALTLGLLAASSTLVPTRCAAHDDLGLDTPRMASLDGTWRLVSPPLDGGRTEYKTIAGGRFIWYVVADGRLVGSAGGRMSYRDGVYLERIEFSATDELGWMVGAVGRFTVLREGDRWHHRGRVTAADHGMSARVDEHWVRTRQE